MALYGHTVQLRLQDTSLEIGNKTEYCSIDNETTMKSPEE